MKIDEKGVLSDSILFFNTPSHTATELFFYVTCLGSFNCDSSYNVHRKTFHSHLLMYVLSGEGFLVIEENHLTVKANDIVILDCHKPHNYYTTTGWQTLWIHFDGCVSTPYVEWIINQQGHITPISPATIVYRHMNQIIESYINQQHLPEALISAYLNRILSELMLIPSNTPSNVSISSTFIEDVMTYIRVNFAKPLTISDLATYANLSPFHFSRVFKKETGYSPYEFILKTRLDTAKELLKKSDKSVKEVSCEVGFCSESNFISTFKRLNKLTPNQFKKTPM